MLGDITQMGPGMSLGWALLSLAVGVAIVVLIAVRIWREKRDEHRADDQGGDGDVPQ